MNTSTHKPRIGAPRKSRSFRPTSEGLEQRLQLSGQTLGVVASPAVVRNPIGNPTPTPPPILTPLADLAIEGLTVKSVGNNQYLVTATLGNLPPVVTKPNIIPVGGGGGGGALPTPGVTYPGGGVLEITRTDGGTTLSQQKGGTVVDTPDPTQVLATIPIPSLAPGKTIQLSTTTTGRAIFTASAVPAVDASGNQLPFPETNSANDSRTVDNLISRTIPINTATLAAFPTLTNAVQHAQFHLNSTNSTVSIPGFFTKQFNIPGQTVSIDLLLGTVSATYYVNNLNSTSAALTYEKGGLAITVKFADNSDALHTDSLVFPDLSVTNLQVKLFLPLSYNASGQYFNFGTPTASVTGNWNANGLLGSIFDLLLPNIDQKIANGLTGAITPDVLVALAFPLNQQVRSFIPGGRIVSADIQPDQLNLTVETPF